MDVPQACSPGFSGPSSPVSARTLRRIASRSKVRVPRRLQQERRQTAARFRRRARDAALAAAAAGGEAGAGKLAKDQRLIQRLTFGWTLAEQARIEEVGYRRYLDEQLDYESIDDSALENALAEALPTLSMTPFQIVSSLDDEGDVVFELMIASLLRAVYSPRQLFERAVVFWSDHFNIHIFADFASLLKSTDDREVIRPHALGRFPELLSASAHSPAMLAYLTNDTNVRGNPNENYARELMELHTLGVDNGYDERDVKEVARCFTGWTFNGLRFAGAEAARFTFRAVDHDRGRKRVLGHTIPRNGGIEDGERVLEILSEHPNTAEFIARKLLRYFWGYDPKQNAVDKVAGVYTATGGDIRAMLRSVLSKGRMRGAAPKLKRPFHLLASTFRALFADLDDGFYPLGQLYLAGHLPFNWSPPDGYPDDEQFWSGFILPRWNFASTFLASARSGVEIDDKLVRPDWSVTRIVDTLDDYLLNGRMSAATRNAVTAFLQKKNKIDERRLNDAIGLVVASPEFQEY